MDRRRIRRGAGRALRWLIAIGIYAAVLVFAAGFIGPTDAAATDVPAAVARTVDPSGQESPLITLGIAAAGVAALGAWRLTRVSPRRRPAPQPARRREVIVLR